MIKYENDCVGCPTYCIECGRKHAPHYYCDNCGDEAENLYEFDGEQLCINCIEERLVKVNGN